jgi:hypothetical protein
MHCVHSDNIGFGQGLTNTHDTPSFSSWVAIVWTRHFCTISALEDVETELPKRPWASVDPKQSENMSKNRKLPIYTHKHEV